MEKLPKNLYLSTDSYFIAKSREDGEKDLEHLADTGDTEGSWLFAADHSEWYNTCWKRTGESARVYVTQFSFLGKEVSHYHTHVIGREVQTITDQLADIAKSQASLGDTKQEPEDFGRKLSEACISFPSGADIEYYVKLLKINRNCKLDFKIASPRGLMTIKFDEQPNLDNLERYEQHLALEMSNRLKPPFNITPNPAIAKITDSINNHMEGTFKLIMKYRKT